jgi:hypothetical protein
MLLLAAVLAAGCDANTHPTPRLGIAMQTQAERRPWSGPNLEGQQILTANYHLYTTTREPFLVDHMPGFLEAAHQNHLALSGLSAGQAQKRMVVYLMASRNEWADLTQSHLGPQSGPYMHIQAGGYMTEGVCVFWNIGPLRTFRVASHEGLHQLFHLRLRHRPPVWLEEGLCTLAEGFQIRGHIVEFDPADNPDRFTAMRAGLTGGTWIPLRELLVMDAGEAISGKSSRAVQYYGQLWALCLYLRSRPAWQAGVQRLLTDAESGQLHRAAGVGREAFDRQRTRDLNRATATRLFEHYVTRDLDGFERDFMAFVKKTGKVY